ncbi:hypothetical protein GGR58DRAFT_515270 [Xylaria digitata]|nr:hypothetical protein GGR58DRAFT_515270 [Xylaria digitata]
MNGDYCGHDDVERRGKPELPKCKIQIDEQRQIFGNIRLHENSPSPCPITDRHRLERASAPDFANMSWTTSVECDNIFSLSYLPPSPLGSLVCPPVVLMSPLGDIFGETSLGNNNAILLENSHTHEASQALRQWYKNSTNALESLALMPQIGIDQMSPADQDILPNTSTFSPCFRCHDSFTSSTENLIMDQLENFNNTNPTLIVTCDSALTQSTNTVLLETLGVPGLPNFQSMGMAAPIGGPSNFHAFMFRSHGNHDNTPSLKQNSGWQFHPASAFSSASPSSLNGLALNPRGFTRGDVLDNDPARENISESGENGPNASRRYHEARMRSNDRTSAATYNQTSAKNTTHNMRRRDPLDEIIWDATCELSIISKLVRRNEVANEAERNQSLKKDDGKCYYSHTTPDT